VPVYIFIGGAIVTPIILRVKENIIIRSSIIASVIIIVTLGLVIIISVTIIVIIIMRCFLRVYALTGLFSLTEGVFTGFAL
jgi:hypothetical protein